MIKPFFFLLIGMYDKTSIYTMCICLVTKKNLCAFILLYIFYYLN